MTAFYSRAHLLNKTGMHVYHVRLLVLTIGIAVLQHKQPSNACFEPHLCHWVTCDAVVSQCVQV